MTPTSTNTPGKPPRIRVGVGGWTYEPWRNNFYPPGLPHAQELGYASRRLTAIEVNGTYYSTSKPATVVIDSICIETVRVGQRGKVPINVHVL